MKKIIVAIAFVFILTLTGCNFNEDISTSLINSNDNISSSQNTSSIEDKYNVNPDNNTGFMALESEDIRCYDFESAYKMCVQAITEYQSTRKNGEKMDFSKYIENPKLITYLETKLNSFYFFPQEYEVNKTGLIEFEVQEANSTGYHGDRAYIHIAYGCFNGVSESSSSVEFIVKNSNGKLVIAEWYDCGKDTFDTIFRGSIDIKNDDIYWNTVDTALLNKKISEHIKQYSELNKK